MLCHSWNHNIPDIVRLNRLSKYLPIWQRWPLEYLRAGISRVKALQVRTMRQRRLLIVCRTSPSKRLSIRLAMAARDAHPRRINQVPQVIEYNEPHFKLETHQPPKASNQAISPIRRLRGGLRPHLAGTAATNANALAHHTTDTS